jgi:hypothetical protein
MSVPSGQAHLPLALPRRPTDLADMLAMGALTLNRSVQRPLGLEHLPERRSALEGFLNRLLGMLRLDQNGSGPGICMLCESCGNVRLRRVWLAPVSGETVALRGFCPRCGRQVEAKFEL